MRIRARQLALGQPVECGARRRAPARRASPRPCASRTSTSKPPACSLEPGQVLLVIGGVGDGQEALGAQPVGEQVVEHAAVVAAQHRVLRAALGDLRDVVGQDPLQEGSASGPEVSISPMWETSNIPAARAHVHVLLADALVLHGHLPAGEGHEPGAGPLVAVEEGVRRRVSVAGTKPPGEAARLHRCQRPPRCGGGWCEGRGYGVRGVGGIVGGGGEGYRPSRTAPTTASATSARCSGSRRSPTRSGCGRRRRVDRDRRS